MAGHLMRTSQRALSLLDSQHCQRRVWTGVLWNPRIALEREWLLPCDSFTVQIVDWYLTSFGRYFLLPTI